MSYAEILLEIADGVAVVTLNRPERMNAYTPTMGRELADAFAACDADDAVRAIVVTGAGRAFCAGADLARGGASFDREAAAEYQETPPDRPWAKPRRAIAPWDVRKPIIAAINGAAVGVGATLPMQWDIRLAAESARIGFVFVRRGVVPEALSTWTLPRIVGMARAAELLLSGRILDAREVRAGAERAPGAGDDDRADGVVRVAGGERLRELASHRRRVCVQPLGTVERDDGDAALDLDEDLAEGHAPTLTPRRRALTRPARGAAGASRSRRPRPGPRP